MDVHRSRRGNPQRLGPAHAARGRRNPFAGSGAGRGWRAGESPGYARTYGLAADGTPSADEVRAPTLGPGSTRSSGPGCGHRASADAARVASRGMASLAGGGPPAPLFQFRDRRGASDRSSWPSLGREGTPATPRSDERHARPRPQPVRLSLSPHPGPSGITRLHSLVNRKRWHGTTPDGEHW